MRDRVQRRHDQRRHLLSDDGEEASARAGDRAREPAALHLSGRLRRRQPAEPDRGVSRPRAFRPHLLQPGDAVEPAHSADRRGDGLVHRGRRLCAGDVGRDHHRQEPGHDLPRRPAAGEGGDRRGGERGGSGRRRSCMRASPASPIIWRRTTITRCRIARRIVANLNTQEDRRHSARRRRASRRSTRPSSTASCRSTSRSNTTCAR